jgi:hypothetical protein
MSELAARRVGVSWRRPFAPFKRRENFPDHFRNSVYELSDLFLIIKPSQSFSVCVCLFVCLFASAVCLLFSREEADLADNAETD